jgi:hypothetical protein
LDLQTLTSLLVWVASLIISGFNIAIFYSKLTLKDYSYYHTKKSFPFRK